MIIFSGLNIQSEAVIFDYTIGDIHPKEEYEYEFTYEGYETANIDIVHIEFPEITVSTMDEILRSEGTEVSSLTVTLLWNAEENLDLTFVCDEQTTINSSNKGGKNDCRAKLDIEKNEKDFDSERGDGSFG